MTKQKAERRTQMAGCGSEQVAKEGFAKELRLDTSQASCFDKVFTRVMVNLRQGAFGKVLGYVQSCCCSCHYSIGELVWHRLAALAPQSVDMKKTSTVRVAVVASQCKCCWVAYDDTAVGDADGVVYR